MTSILEKQFLVMIKYDEKYFGISDVQTNNDHELQKQGWELKDGNQILNFLLSLDFDDKKWEFDPSPAVCKDFDQLIEEYRIKLNTKSY